MEAVARHEPTGIGALPGLIVMPTIPQSIQSFFDDHQARLAAVSAVPGVVGLSLDLDQISATYLSKEIQILVRPKYCAHCNAGTTPEDKISRLASFCFALSETSEATGFK